MYISSFGAADGRQVCNPKERNGKMISLPLGENRASDDVVNVLVSIGALYKDETGIRANEPGIYKIEIPTQTANQSGDK